MQKATEWVVDGRVSRRKVASFDNHDNPLPGSAGGPGASRPQGSTLSRRATAITPMLVMFHARDGVSE